MKATIGYVENVSIEVEAKPEEWVSLCEALRAGRKTKLQKATLGLFAVMIEGQLERVTSSVTNIVNTHGTEAD